MATKIKYYIWETNKGWKETSRVKYYSIKRSRKKKREIITYQNKKIVARRLS